MSLQPIHTAALEGELPTVQQELQKGVNVEAKDNSDWTPLHCASRKGHLTIVQYLAEQAGADLEAQNNFGQTPLHIASWKDRLIVAKY